MKKFKLLNILLLFSLFAIVSCGDDENINQDYIETLAAGDWTLTSTTINGVERDFGGILTSHSQTHLSCDLEVGDCSGSNSYVLELDNNGGTITGGSSFTYKIHDEGTMITFNVSTTTTNGVTTPCTTGCVTVFEILEWTDTKHRLQSIDANGDTVIRTMERL